VHPVLLPIHLGGVRFDLPTYGVLLALAFIVILRTASGLARREGLSPRDVVDVGFTVFLAGLVGAKVLLVLLDFRAYMRDPAALLGTLRSAGVFYGGLVAAVPAGIWMVRRRGLPVWKVADIAGVCVPIGLAIGRWGCFAAGCCWGRPTSLPWAVTFTDPQAHATTGVPLNVSLHPTQIYESLGALVLFLVLLALHRRKTWDGQVGLWFVVLYGLMRSAIEIFRGDEVRGFLVPDRLSTSQAIGLSSVLLALLLMAWRRRRIRLG
jgi:phosphatidylglycerol---prolipoprotein diacylglyceryl transferase